MNPHQAGERDEFESRVRSVAHLVSDKLGVRIDSHDDGAAVDAEASGDFIHRRLVEPFRAWWDFDKPWRNKK